MFWNNFKIALRNLRKNKLFAAINIVGLALGLTIYLFGGLLVKYEQTHDLFFDNAARVYTVGSHTAPGLGVGIDVLDASFSALGPILEAELSDVEAVARTNRREFLITVGEDGFYESIRFTDPALLRIFNLNYLYGDESALDDASGILITETVAMKYFGDTNVIGEVITLDNEFDYHISAVIENVPLNSHFNSSIIIDSPLGILAPMKALSRMRDFDIEGDWSNLSIGDLTYVLLPDSLDGDWLQTQVDSIFERLVSDDTKEVISGFLVSPLQHANLSVWDTIGMPVISVIKLLSLLVLIVACVNYTNLATAQSLGRSREVGMRKTMGAGQSQLLAQFLVESLTITTIAMIVAIAALELIIPLFNNAANKVLTLNYLSTLPWLLVTTILVGLFAGAYPAWLITRSNPIDALRDTARKGKKGSKVRSVMIGTQFAISAFMLALVTIVFMQNEKVKEAGNIFPRSEIYTLGRLNVDAIRDRLDTLRHELEALPNVDAVSFSSQVPFEQNTSQFTAAAQQGDEAGKFNVNQMAASPEFFDTYDIPLLAGRNISRSISNDERKEDSEVLNVLVNELMLAKLGMSSPAEAVNQRFYNIDDADDADDADDDDDANKLREFIIVGVVPTQNILGLFNSEKPWVFYYGPDRLRIGSVRVNGNFIGAIEQVEKVWNEVIPDYPIQGRFLDEVFDDVYVILKMMNTVLAGFAFVALALALIGLFGLAAFMAAQRTKEIGIRKVLGANSAQIARLLVWQFSKPVLWALVIALPAAFVASNTYLDFFADRIDTPIVILLVSGLVAVMLAWGTVAGHAFKISRSNPILALRYE